MNGLLAIVRLAFLLLSFIPGPVGAAAVLSESPTTIVPGGTVDATWSGIDTPTPHDWIALYLQGAQDEGSFEPTSWIFINTCTQIPDVAGKASGSCPYILPGNLTPGIWELRLLADNGFTLLARSNPFAVTGPIEIVSFNIDNGAASTTSHTVTLNFTTGPTSPVPDAFRAVEGGSLQELISKPFAPLTSPISAPFTLAPRGRDGARYGGRPILLQVKSGSQMSFPRIDTIRLNPVMREYTTGNDEAFDYARRSGYVVTMASDPDSSDPEVCKLCPVGTQAQAGHSACTTTTTVIFFTGRELRPFWRLKKVEPSVGQAFPINQNVFRWTFSNTAPPDPSLGDYAACGDPLDTIVLVPFCLLSPLVCAGLARWERGCAPKGLACFPFAPDLPPATLTFEGPTEDDLADPLKPWKNAFTPGAFRLITPKLPSPFPRR